LLFFYFARMRLPALTIYPIECSFGVNVNIRMSPSTLSTSSQQDVDHWRTLSFPTFSQ
jgi:hypothetical protein